MNAIPPSEKAARLRALLAVLCGTSVRPNELAPAAVQDLSYRIEDDGQQIWELDVVGAGRAIRTAQISGPVMDALLIYFRHRFGEPRPPVGVIPIPLFSTLPSAHAAERALTPDSIIGVACDLFQDAASAVETSYSDVAVELRNVSARWLRHALATHAAKYDQVRLELLQTAVG